MLDTHGQTGARLRQTNKNHSYLTSTANQTAINTHCDTNLQTKMDSNKNNNRQNPDKLSCNPEKYTREPTLKKHWGADDEIMKIINRRDSSPKTNELVERKIELTKPGQMRYSWHKRLETEILLPRSPGDTDRKEIKRIDMQLRRKEECRDTHLEGGHFNDFRDEIPPRAKPKQTPTPSPKILQQTPNLRPRRHPKNRLSLMNRELIQLFQCMNTATDR